MIQSYIDPNEVYIADFLNNRAMNQNYIEDLEESMRDKGFLPAFPVDVFLSENLTMIETALPYVCACGNHRTKAAQLAGLKTILAHVHDGTEEAFVETMHLDNFQFDPVHNSAIGQAFTRKEKKNAIVQLLFVPKFFEMTNMALSDKFRISEGTIRNYREEVVTMLDTDSPKLRLFAISDGRLERLRKITKSHERVNEDGKIVKVRQKVAEVTIEEKEAFYEQIERDWKAACDVDFSHVRQHLMEAYALDSRFRQYEDLSMTQLQKIHAAILADDDDFFDAVLSLEEKAEKEFEIRREFEVAHDAFLKQFKKSLAPNMNEYSAEFKSTVKAFEKFISVVEHEEFMEEYKAVKLSYYDYDRDDYAFMEAHLEALEGITHDLNINASWVAEFAAEMKRQNAETFQKLSKNWIEHRDALLTAIAAYPRDISEDAILSAAENNYNYTIDRGELRFLIDAEGPSRKKHIETIAKEAKLFKDIANDIAKDKDYIQAIPIPKKLVEVIVEKEAQKVSEHPLTVEDSKPSLAEAFAEIKARVIHLDNLHSEEIRLEFRSQMLKILGEASRGFHGTQLWLLADLGEWLSEKGDAET